MICDRKPYVIEFNARFGDPETQVVLPLLETDLLEVFLAIDNAELKNLNVKWSEDSAVCVVLASKGYPGDYEKNKLVSGLEDAAKTAHAQVIHAGTKTDPFGKVLTSGGRVLGVVARRDSLDKAIQSAYEALAKIRFEGKTFRTDIGAKALAKQRS
jgi:phosphoribosylamine--glycine ligase